MAVQKKFTKNGQLRWVGRYRDYAKRERSKSFDTQREAKAWVAEKERALRRGEWIDPASEKTTLGELVEEYKRLASRPGTRRDRKVLYDNLGSLRDMPISAVRPSHIQEWAQEMRDGRPWAGGSKLSASTVQVKTGQLRTVLRRAVKDGLIVSSPAEVLFRFDAGEKEDFYVPTDDEVRRIYKKSRGWFYLAVRLATECGLRAGEVCGLRVQDVDFLRRVIHVRVQSAPGKAGGVVALKSRDSRRDVPMSESLAMALSRSLDGREVGPDDRILMSERGLPLFSSRVSQTMSETRKWAKVDERVHFHSLRHLYASRLLAAGVALPTVSRLLGHSNPVVTARVYAHHLPGQDGAVKSVVDALAGFVRDSPSKKDEGESADGRLGSV